MQLVAVVAVGCIRLLRFYTAGFAGYMRSHSKATSKMSTLKVNQIRGKIQAMFEPNLDVKDIGANDSEREQKILSRCLAAFAVYLTSGCSEKEASESVWDGADDNGIDAAFFDASEKRVIFVQSKWINKGSGEPEAKDLAGC